MHKLKKSLFQKNVNNYKTLIYLLLKKVKNVLPNEMLVKRHKSLDKFTQTLSFIISQANHTFVVVLFNSQLLWMKKSQVSIQLMLMHKKLTLYTCFCTPRSQLCNCLQKPWRECMGAQLSFGSAFAAGEAWKTRKYERALKKELLRDAF